MAALRNRPAVAEKELVVLSVSGNLHELATKTGETWRVHLPKRLDLHGTLLVKGMRLSGKFRPLWARYKATMVERLPQQAKALVRTAWRAAYDRKALAEV